MNMFKTFQCIINFHMIILYFGADICKCMTAPQMKTNGKSFELKNIDGKTTSVHSTIVLKDIEFENRKFYGENSTPNKWYKVQVISEKLVDESISNQQNEGIPKSLCHLCKVQASVAAYIRSSNLSEYYEGTTRNLF